MNKIIKALLEAKYPAVDVNALLEIIHKTPSPEIATEIICGLYQEPWVSPSPCEKFKATKFEVELKGYNKWEDAVEYKFKSRKSKCIWSRKGSELPLYADVQKFQEEYYFKDFVKRAEIEGLTEEHSDQYERRYVYGDLETSFSNGTCRVIDWNGDINPPS